MTQRICLVSSGNVASNPRLVKEADALHGAGYDVHVIAADVVPRVRKLDETVLGKAGWSWELVGRGSFSGHTLRVARQRLAALGWRTGISRNTRTAIRAGNWLTPRLTAAALEQPADLYIAHNLAALPAASAAAEAFGVRFAFDAEDFHAGELPAIPANDAEIRRRHTLQKQFLATTAFVTAASPLISQALQEHYGIHATTILNVFPRNQAPPRPKRPTIPGSLYWVSQYIGPNRGLELMLQTLSHIRSEVRLFIRGTADTWARDTLTGIARSIGLEDRVILLPKLPPEELIRDSSRYEMGLSIETTGCASHDMCLGNKLFLYLQAGIPILLSDTAAQREIAGELAGCSLLVNIHDPEQTGATLTEFFSDPQARQRCREEAWMLGQKRFNWDVEKLKFLECVRNAWRPLGRVGAPSVGLDSQCCPEKSATMLS